MNNRNSLYLIGCILIGLLIICGLSLAPTGAAIASSPHIVASYQHNYIEFEEFTPDENLNFEIFDSINGGSLYSETLQTDGAGAARFSAYWSFDIQPGQHIVASDGGDTKDLTVANARYDVLDLEDDQARGTAPEGSRVVVTVHGREEYQEVETLAGSDGTWSAEFVDLDAYLSSKAHVFDEDGDASVAWVPQLEVCNVHDSYIAGQDFTSGGSLSLEIYDQGGNLLYGPADVVASSDHGRMVIALEQHGQELVPGTLISVTDQTSGEKRQLVVEPLTMELFDYDQELIEGTALAGSTVVVSARSNQGYYEVVTQAQPDGSWSADFAAKGADLNPRDDIYARVFDPDADALRTKMPGIMASTTEDFVHWSWHASPVTATIKDPDGNLVFGPETFPGIYEMGIDTPDYDIDLQPGFFIEVDFGNGRVVDLTTADLSVTSLDREANWAAGTAPPGSTVSVMVWETEYPYFAGIAILAEMDVPAEDGTWQADFGGRFDISTGHSVVVMLSEFDGGVSAAAYPNSAPVIHSIQGPAEPVAINTTIMVSASFSDDHPGEVHTAVWDWGDGTTSSETIDETNGLVEGSHTYAAVSVYVPKLTLCDEFNACASSAYSYIVVTDTVGGFVTGGGWINSPEGAYVPDPTLTGKASFGFVAKYKKGAAVPAGNSEFQFRAAQLNFHSTSYDWLLVTGNNFARFKGTGTVNGENGYIFLIWARDGDPDTFRIRIWKVDGSVIYDNGSHQPISAGSIIVHAN